MSKEIHRAHQIQGTKADFNLATEGMKPINNVPGINVGELRWFVHPETCKIVHLINIEQRTPYEDVYTWAETIYDPKSRTGFSSSGRKIVRLGEKTYYLSRIIASTFIENDKPQERTIVFHKNREKTDCRAINLIWISPKELKLYRKTHIRIKLNIRKTRQVNI